MLATSNDAGGSAASSNDAGGSRSTSRITAAAVEALKEYFREHSAQWSSLHLPRGNSDSELTAILTKYNLNRAQASRQWRKYRREQGVGRVEFDTNPETVMESLRQRIGGVEDAADHIMQAFEACHFCNERLWPGADAPPLQIVERCRDAIRTHVAYLVERYLGAVAHHTATSAHNVNSMLLALAVTRKAERELQGQSFEADSAIKQAADDYYRAPHGIRLVYCNLEQKAWDTFTQLLADHEKPDLTVPDPLPAVDFSDARAGLLYYLSGWLCFKIGHAILSDEDSHKDFWSEWAKCNTLEAHEAHEQQLPYELLELRVQQRQRKWRNSKNKERIVYASRALLEFVWAVEATYVKLLTTANMLAYSSELINTIHSLIVENEPTLAFFWATVSEDMRARHQDAEGEMRFLLRRVLKSYCRMRGRDFVRVILKDIRAADEADQRNSLRANLAATAARASKAAKKKRQNQALEKEGEEALVVVWQRLDEAEAQADAEDMLSEEVDERHVSPAAGAEEELAQAEHEAARDEMERAEEEAMISFIE